MTSSLNVGDAGSLCSVIVISTWVVVIAPRSRKLILTIFKWFYLAIDSYVTIDLDFGG